MGKTANYISLNAKSLIVACRFCDEVPTVRDYGSHILKFHGQHYKRGLCHFCGHYQFIDKKSGDAHKLNCLQNKVMRK